MRNTNSSVVPIEIACRPDGIRKCRIGFKVFNATSCVYFSFVLQSERHAPPSENMCTNTLSLFKIVFIAGLNICLLPKEQAGKVNKLGGESELDKFLCLPDYSLCVRGTLAVW